MLTPQITYFVLLVVQALHLLHHRVTKRHISFAEVVSAVVLCVPPFAVSLPAWVFMGMHLILNRHSGRWKHLDQETLAGLVSISEANTSPA